MGERSELAWKFFALTTPTLPTFHMHKFVHSMLTIAVFCIEVDSPIDCMDVQVAMVPSPSSPPWLS